MFKTKNHKSIKLEKLFEDYLEMTCKGVYVYYVEDEYMLIDEGGICISKRYKNISNLMSWYYDNKDNFI